MTYGFFCGFLFPYANSCKFLFIYLLTSHHYLCFPHLNPTFPQ